LDIIFYQRSRNFDFREEGFGDTATLADSQLMAPGLQLWNTCLLYFRKARRRVTTVNSPCEVVFVRLLDE
jgi:hypothetical protein